MAAVAPALIGDLVATTGAYSLDRSNDEPIGYYHRVVESSLSYVFAGLVGFSLSAACGMRIFAPIAVLSIACHFGWIQPASSFAWIATTPAMVCLVIACVLEILGMMIPWFDHVLDVAGAPVAAVAGTLVMASQLAAHSGIDTSAVPAWITWSLAVVVGGGVATGVHAATGTVRAGSTAVSGGLLNPVFAIIETISSFMVVILAIVMPVLAVAFALFAVGGLLLFAYLVIKLRRRYRAKSVDAVPIEA